MEEIPRSRLPVVGSGIQFLAQKSLRMKLYPGTAHQLRELIAAAEGPGVDLLHSGAADQPSERLAVLEAEGRNGANPIRERQLLQTGTDKGVAQSLQRFAGS